MKKITLVTLCLLLGLLVSTSFGTEITVLGPNQYTRTTGAPDVFTDMFTATPGEGVLIVKNGNLTDDNRTTDALSSATIYLNGEQIFGLNDFNQQVYFLEAPVNLAENNSISIELASNPGSYLTIEVKQEIDPPTVNFSADPGSILLGESSTLAWISTNAETCVIDPEIGSVDVSGSTQVSPTETTTYIITVTGPGGTATASVTVTVTGAAPPPTMNISAFPNTIQVGESSTLSWRSTNAYSFVIEPGIGSVPVNGSIAVSPIRTIRYTITATGLGGTATASVIVTVGSQLPPFVSISADPETILAGDSSTLSWTSTNANSCVIEPGIGSVDVNGSIQVSPEETTTYTITAFGPGGTAAVNVTVTITSQSPPAVSISADPEIIPIGGSSTLSWTSTHADFCAIEPNIGSIDLNGSVTVSPTETTTYTIIATGPWGTSTDAATVTIAVAPIVYITAPVDMAVVDLNFITVSGTVDRNDADVWVNGIAAAVSNGTFTAETIPLQPGANRITATASIAGVTGSDNIHVVRNYEYQPQPENSLGEQYEDLVPSDSSIAAYDPKRFAVITGLVQAIDNSPIENVYITIHNHLEYGTAITNPEGRFSIPVEGGGTITIVYQKDGLISAQRKVYVPWNDIAIVETIRMIVQDSASTTLTFDGNPETIITHQSTEVRDEFGNRSCAMVFTGDNRAYSVDDKGQVLDELTTITARATEFTTPEFMPAILPPNSAYTYCVELSVDGFKRVKFEKPVVTWVNNFIGFEVGAIVPVGYYDRDRGVWVPSDNGVVVKLLDTDSDGLVDALDANGDEQPDDLDGNGFFSDEVAGLNDAQRYPPSSTFWRVMVTHFTPWDYNWPYAPPADAIPPNPEGVPYIDQQNDEQKDCQSHTGSFVEERSRIFHEDIPIPGTDITLHYSSNRVEGYKVGITVPASGETVPNSLKRIIVKVDVAGRKFDQILAPLPNQKAELIWDGRDHLDRAVNDPTTARVNIGFVYNLIYYDGSRDFRQAFAQAGSDVTGIVGRQEVISWKRFDIVIRMNRFNSHSVSAIAKGWTLSSHHHLSPVDPSRLFRGDGTINMTIGGIITTVAGSGLSGYSGDGGPATQAQLGYPKCIAVDDAGNLYIADSFNDCIRKVDKAGIITTVAGTGTGGCSGDGGPATQAQLLNPWGVALDTSGNLYIADTGNDRIRKVDTCGVITTVAGTGTKGYSGDGGPAVQAQIERPLGLTVDAGDNLYFVDYYNNRIRKVDTAGSITTVAGIGLPGYDGDGGPATQAQLGWPLGIALDAVGNLYIADSDNDCIRKVDTAGIITTVAGIGQYSGCSGDGGPATQARIAYPAAISVDTAGNLYISDGCDRIRKVDTSGIIATVAGIGTEGYSGDGGPPTLAELNNPHGVAVDAADNLYFVDTYNLRIRRVDFLSFMAGIFADKLVFTEENGIGHIMSSAGRHETTIDLYTGVTLYEFGYDQNNNLIAITDRFGEQIIINRDDGSVPYSITSPDGIITNLTIDANNQLTGITYPDSTYHSFEYTLDGLLTAKVEPEGNRFEHTFDSFGRLTDATDPEGGHWHYTRAAYDNGDILTEVLTAEGNRTSYLDHTCSTGAYTSTITDPTGAETLFAQSADGLTVNKSLPCGMEFEFKYDADSEHKFKYIKEMRQSTPSALQKITLRDKTYQDTNLDDIPDLITKTVTVNGKTTTLENNTIQSQKTITSPEGRTVTTLYDPATLLATSVTLPDFFATTYGYDTKGRLTSIDTNTRGTDFTYNVQGFLETVIDPKGYTTNYDHDAVGRVTGIGRPDGSYVGFMYDHNGNMIVLTNPSTIDHSFGYNKVNRNNSYQTPLSGRYSYLYDKDRRLIQTNFPSGNQINNVYDQTRLMQIQTPEGNIDFSYLCGTKTESITSATNIITYGYDGSLVTSKTLTGILNQSLGYTFNNDFDFQSFTYAGDTVNYIYDNDGLLTGTGSFTITRNAGNGLPEVVTGGALNLSRTFNGYGEVDGQTFTVNGQGLNSWSLSRDDNGRITQKTETTGGITSNYMYTYDPMGRLLTVTKDGALVEEYEYGQNGTRTYEMNTLREISGRTFDYSDEDHLLTAGATTYQYDVDGFLTVKTDGSEVTTYDYSSRGELLSVTLPDGTLIEYIHDPWGRRIAKKVDGLITEKYLWQGLTRLLALYDGSDNLVMRFEYADGRMPVAMTSGVFTYYLTYDQVGSLKVVADSSGNVIKRIEYDSFGNIIDDTDPAFIVPFGFAGGLHDRDTGLVRFGYRDYDPDVGRWTAKDPILFAGGDTDLYGYVLNNPVNLIDPLGLINWWAVGKGGFAVVGGAVTAGLGALASSSGIGAVGGVPAVLGGAAAFSWGVAQIITGFTDNEIPFMGTGEAIIKGSTEEGLLQDELLGVNTLGGMLFTGRVQPSNIGKINTVIKSGYSIFNSGSHIKESMDSNCK